LQNPNRSTAKTLVYAKGGLSEFSRYSGYSTTYISKCLNGERKISPAFCKAVCDWLGLEESLVFPPQEQPAVQLSAHQVSAITDALDDARKALS
jgi:transcriptional regulator with XRE-family HTH domain